MKSGSPRFECRPDEDGMWMVWDNKIGAPASLGGPLVRRERRRAEAACEILCRIYETDREFPTQRFAA